MVEDLIQLVAASFARNGLEGRTSDSPIHESNSAPMSQPEPSRITALPDHNFRKNLQGDPAP